LVCVLDTDRVAGAIVAFFHPCADSYTRQAGGSDEVLGEVVARLTKNWEADGRAFDAVYDHILMMSDALADGIVKQFPNRFNARSTTRR
jgi:hypothetical protein